MSSIFAEILETRNPWWFQNKAVVPETKRILVDLLSEKREKILVLLGPRQTGKTTILLQYANDRSDIENVIYVPVDSLIMYSENPIIDAVRYFENYYLKSRIEEKKCILIFDEVHFDPNWGLEIKALIDRISGRKNVQILISGSSATMISRELQRYLTGRFDVMYVGPLTLAEALDIKYGIKLFEEGFKAYSIFQENKINDIVEKAEEVLLLITKYRSLIRSEIKRAIFYGFMPEIVAKNLSEWDAINRLSSYAYVTLMKDIIRVADTIGAELKKSAKLESMLRILLYNSPRITSYNDIARNLGISRDTAEVYFNWLVSTQLIHKAKNYAKSLAVEEKRRKFKVFSVDVGIRNAIIYEAPIHRLGGSEEGRALENIVLSHMLTILKWLNWTSNVRFFWYKGGREEIDIIMKLGTKIIPIEVKRERDGTVPYIPSRFLIKAGLYDEVTIKRTVIRIPIEIILLAIPPTIAKTYLVQRSN